jgi:gliding motility-associated-like protein
LNGLNFSIVYGDSVQLELNNPVGIINWLPVTNGCGNCSSLVVSPEYSTQYQVVLTSEYGCISTEYINVNVTYEDHVDVPDNFSPNNDGKNDILYVKGFAIKEMSFRIFNRYGQLIFESEDQSVGWDGKVMNVLSNSATFVYTLKYELMDGSLHHKSGHVNLIR